MHQSVANRLQRIINGRWIEPDSEHYDAARAVYNGDIRRRPAGIAYVATIDEALACINVLSAEMQQYTIRSSGHNVAGRSVADGMPVIDLSMLNGAVLDPDQTVRVQGGATWADVDASTSIAGLVVPGGIVPSTGVGGLTLGGGVGWLLPSLGLASDQLVSARVASTDGREFLVSADENPSLLSALRGGGHGLGIVLEFTFSCNPLRSIFGGWIRFRPEAVRRVLQVTADLLPKLSPGVMISPALINLPGKTGYCEIDIVGHGVDEEVRELVQVLGQLGAVESDVGPKSYRFVQTMTDMPRRRGTPSYWRSLLVDELTPELIEHLTTMYLHTSPPDSIILIEYYHGRYHVEPTGGSVFPWRGLSTNIVAIANWHRGAHDYQRERRMCADWAHQIDDYRPRVSTQPESPRYVNYDTRDDAVERLARSNHHIQRAKQILDPSGLLTRRQA